MFLVTIDDRPNGSPGARLSSGDILHLARAARPGTVETWLPASNLAILEGGTEALDVVRRMVARAEGGGGADELSTCGALLPPDTRLLAPIPEPRMIIAAGLAYRSHLAEMANTPAPAHPTAFMKSPASVGAPGAILHLPPQASKAVDYEGELALVFGRSCHAVSPADAMACIAGYTAANDVSARDWGPAVHAAKDPWPARLAWEVNIMGKQFPGFTALGPALATVDEVRDPGELRIVTRLNGKVMQDSPVSDLIFPIADVVSYLSRWYTFRAGDVLLTGTPAGVGAGRTPQVFMHPGDTIEVEIAPIGSLITPIRAPAAG